MANDFYNASGNPLSEVRGIAQVVRTEFAAVQAGFDALPSLDELVTGTTNYGIDTGVANAYVVTLPEDVEAYVDGMAVSFTPTHTSIAGTPTINVNGLGQVAVSLRDGSIPVGGEIIQGIPAEFRYGIAAGLFYMEQNPSAAANAAAAAAAASAATALSAPGTSATSSTSDSIALGSTSIIVQQGKQFVVGMSVKMASTVSPVNWNFGDITAYVPSSGLLTINVTRTQGSGTFADWTVSISGPAFQDGNGGGSFRNTTAADITLTSASARLQSIIPIRCGLAFILPDATSLPSGPGQFELGCILEPAPVPDVYPFQAFPMLIKDSTGTILGFVSPGATVTANLLDSSTAAGEWQIQGATRFGTEAAGLVTLSASIGGTAGVWTKSVILDANRTLLLVHGTALHGIVYDASTHQFGSPLLIRTGISTTGSDGSVAAVLAAANTVLVTSIIDGSTSFSAVGLTISGSVITLGTAASATLTFAAARIVGVYVVGTSFVMAYMNATTSINARALTISGSTVTIGAAEQTLASAGPAALLVSGATFVLVGSSATAVTAKGFSVAGSVITAGATSTMTASVLGSILIRASSGGGWFVTCINSTGVIAILSLSGTTPAFSAQVAISSITTISNVDMAIGAAAGDGTAISINTCVSGTDSAGRFVTEVGIYSNAGTSIAPPVPVISFATSTAHISSLVPQSVYTLLQIASAKEIEIYALQDLSNGINNKIVSLGLQTLSSPILSPEATSPTRQHARTTLSSTSAFVMGTGDGTKPGIMFSRLSLGSAPYQLIAPLSFSARGATPGESWVCTNQAPSKELSIQKVRLA